MCQIIISCAKLCQDDKCEYKEDYIRVWDIKACNESSISIIIVSNFVQYTTVFCVDKHEENSVKTHQKNFMFLLTADYTVLKLGLSIIFVKKFA